MQFQFSGKQKLSWTAFIVFVCSRLRVISVLLSNWGETKTGRLFWLCWIFFDNGSSRRVFYFLSENTCLNSEHYHDFNLMHFMKICNELAVKLNIFNKEKTWSYIFWFVVYIPQKYCFATLEIRFWIEDHVQACEIVSFLIYLK